MPSSSIQSIPNASGLDSKQGINNWQANVSGTNLLIYIQCEINLGAPEHFQAPSRLPNCLCGYGFSACPKSIFLFHGKACLESQLDHHLDQPLE